MNVRQILCAILIVFSATTARAQNQIATWGEAGGWKIAVDRTVGDGCFALGAFNGGTVTRIGYDANQSQIYLLFADEAWKSLEAGKLYPVRILFDGGNPYEGEMRGQQLGNMVVLAHRNLSTDFVKDFMQRNSMQVYYRGQPLFSISLRGTYAAIAEVINCQREFGFGKANPAGNASDQTRKPDPFR